MSQVYFSLAGGDFFQDWSSVPLANDDWSGVASLVGYRGDGLASTTGANPSNITADDAGRVVDVNVGQSTTLTTGGVAYFSKAGDAGIAGDATIALQGSGTARAPYLELFLDATGRQNLHLEFDLRHVDGDFTTQQFVVQYRLGDTGAWTNLPGSYLNNPFPSAAAPNSLHQSFDLPATLAGQGQVELRFMTTDATSSDEWLGVDNIKVTSQAQVGAAVTVGDATITEGDAGDKVMTFVVSRSDTGGDFTVDYATGGGTATAGTDYAAASGTLHFTAGGPATQTISVVVHGDTAVETNETFNLALSNLHNNAGAASVFGAGVGIGTIVNDDFQLVHTYEIQGASHTSPLLGAHVSTEGVVTAIDTTGSRGFWIQDPTGDGDARTSDAVFVFTNAVPAVHVGDMVHVSGTVTEFQGSDTNNLTITEVSTSNASVSVLGGGYTLAPTVIGGDGGLHPPTEAVDSDHFATFNPDHDGIDFYESLEGMLVTIKNAQAVDSTFSNETFVVADGGADASGMNDRGGITIAPGDMNPEKIELFTDSGVTPITFDTVAGDHLGDVTGVVSYFGGNYEVIPLSAGATGTAGEGGQAPRETTALAGDADHVTIGAYNVENLDPTDPDAKFADLGRDIAQNLGGPDILGLEEIQDADGAGKGLDLSGAATLTKLIQAIEAAGGPHYQYVEIAPTVANTTGGESNGNIRQAFLYNPDRVTYVDGSARQIVDDDPANGDAYNNSRKPLVADFQFHGETITAIDVHNYSRGGSDELFGLDQPPVNAGDQRRIDQTAPVEHAVQQIEQANPQAHVVVMGDFNGFQFETAQTQLETGGILQNLTSLLQPTDRYSYIFEGDMEQIDQLYVSPSLQGDAQFDIVHLNTGQADRPTDHDPILSRLFVNTAPTGAADSYTGQEGVALTADAAHGVLANDSDANGDRLTAVLVEGPQHGTLALNADGSFTYQAQDSYIGADSFTYYARDPSGATAATQTVDLRIAPAPLGPPQSGGNGADTLAGTVSSELISGGDGDDRLDGQVGADSLNGGNGQDTVLGGAGTDAVSGGNGEDSLDGGSGFDRLDGGNGKDTLVGGAGDDLLAGGNGADRFVFQAGFGHDVVADFAHGDQLQFDPAVFASFAAVMSHAQQVGLDVVITDPAGDSVTLSGVQLASLRSSDFLFA